MDIPQVLEALGLGNVSWGPGGHTGATYDDLARGWPGEAPLPSRGAMAAEWARLQAEDTPAKRRQARRQRINARIAAGEDTDEVWDALIQLAKRVEALEKKRGA